MTRRFFRGAHDKSTQWQGYKVTRKGCKTCGGEVHAWGFDPDTYRCHPCQKTWPEEALTRKMPIVNRRGYR